MQGVCGDETGGAVDVRRRVGGGLLLRQETNEASQNPLIVHVCTIPVFNIDPILRVAVKDCLLYFWKWTLLEKSILT